MDNTIDMEHVRVSIILPTYNGALRIASAIESIRTQSYQEWELLIIDDGSTDDTESIVSDFSNSDSRIRYIKNTHNLGIQKSLNSGLREARGEYIARIDDDDIWPLPDKLTLQVDYLDKNPTCVLVGTGVILVDESGKELMRYFVPETDTEIRRALLGKNCFVHSSVLFRREQALLCGGYDETMGTRHVEDYDLWLKLGIQGALANLRIYGVRFMVRGGSVSSQNKIEQFKKNFFLIQKFKHAYPQYVRAYLRSLLRICVYGFFSRLPFGFSFERMLKWYKKLW